MSAVGGNVIRSSVHGRGWCRPWTGLFEGTAKQVADIPPAELLDAAYVSLSLARFQPGTDASYGCCVKAMLCLTRLVDECRPDGRTGA